MMDKTWHSIAETPVKALSRSFSALQYHNYRLFFFGQCISLIGTWMQNIGQSWLVLQLTGSAFKLSLVSTVQFLPMMLFALFAGTLVDRFPKRRVLLFTQGSLAVLAVILASLTYFKVVQYWHVLLLALLLGIVNTIDMPTRQSFFSELVEKKDLMNAIALNSSIFNLARILGPAVAGLLIGLVGIAVCFYLNALSFVAVITGLWLINTPAHTVGGVHKGSARHIFSDIMEGLKYIVERKVIMLPLLLLALISTFVMNFNVLVPVYAQQNMNQNATGYGFLMTCMGIGSFVGAITIAAMSRSGPKLVYMLGGAFGMSLFLVMLSFEKNYELACVTLFAIGFCSIIFTALVNSTIQLNSADNMRGRVMSVYSLVFGGVTPIGSLYAGNLTELAGAPVCMMVSGFMGISGAGAVMLFISKKQKLISENNSNLNP